MYTVIHGSRTARVHRPAFSHRQLRSSTLLTPADFSAYTRWNARIREEGRFSFWHTLKTPLFYCLLFMALLAVSSYDIHPCTVSRLLQFYSDVLTSFSLLFYALFIVRIFFFFFITSLIPLSGHKFLFVPSPPFFTYRRYSSVFRDD